MSFNVGSEIATANHFIGLASSAQRDEVFNGITDEDSRRKFWVYHMLPKLNESFLDDVMKSEEKCKHFLLDGLDDPNLPPRHFIMFQSFAHLCVPLKSVSARHMPWQFRIVLHKNTRAVLNSSHATDMALRNDVFDKAGWIFWITDDGFCIAPKAMIDELSDISAMYNAWLKTRNEYEPPSSFKNDLPTPSPNSILSTNASLLSHLSPEPPVLERLSNRNA